MWLIDNEDYNLVDICYVPLAHSLFIQNVTSKSEEELYNTHRNKIEFIVEELFADFSENDVRVLEKTIDYLYDKQKHLIVAIIHSILNEVLKPYGIKQAILSLNGIIYLSPEFRLEKLKKIQKLKFCGEQPQIIEFYFSLGNEYRDISKYDDALKMYRKAYRKIQSLADPEMFSLIDYYNYVGIIWNYKEDYSKAITYFNKAVKTLTSLSVKNLQMFSTCYNNLGTTWDYFGNHKKAINFLEKSL
jgi:tetratricopeptide (TPR) repeat protein